MKALGGDGDRPERPWGKRSREDDPVVDKPLVLYVEDEKLNRLVMRKLLSKRYEPVIASTDREACELFRLHRDRLHYILMDIELQGSILNGIELARLVNGQDVGRPLPDYAEGVPVLGTPLLFVTAYSGKYDLMVDLQSAVGVLHKPFSPKKLLEMIHAA